MVQVPAWGGSNGVEDPKCRVLEALVEAVEEVKLVVCVCVCLCVLEALVEAVEEVRLIVSVLEALVEAVEEVRLIVCVYVLGDANVLVLSILNSCVHNIPSCRSWEDWQWERTCAWPCRPSTAVLQQLR